jgi:hypothetical protein
MTMILAAIAYFQCLTLLWVDSLPVTSAPVSESLFPSGVFSNFRLAYSTTSSKFSTFQSTNKSSELFKKESLVSTPTALSAFADVCATICAKQIACLGFAIFMQEAPTKSLLCAGLSNLGKTEASNSIIYSFRRSNVTTTTTTSTTTTSTTTKSKKTTTTTTTTTPQQKSSSKL